VQPHPAAKCNSSVLNSVKQVQLCTPLWTVFPDSAHFWNVVESAAEQSQYEEAVAGLYACLDDIPEGQVKKILAEALSHLDVAARQQGGQRSGAAKVAEQAISDGPTVTAVTGPRDFFSKLYGAFVAEERKTYQEKLRGQVVERQKRVTQILKDSQRADVLTNTRLALQSPLAKDGKCGASGHPVHQASTRCGSPPVGRWKKTTAQQPTTLRPRQVS